MSDFRIPSSVVLAGVAFDVQFTELPESFGECHGGRRLIKIDSTADVETQARTLLHEMIEAVLYVTGQSEVLEDSNREGVVLAFEHAFWPYFALPAAAAE